MKKLIQLILNLIIKDPNKKTSTINVTASTANTNQPDLYDKRIKKGSIVRIKGSAKAKDQKNNSKYGVVNFVTKDGTAFVHDGFLWQKPAVMLKYCDELSLKDLIYLNEFNDK